MTTSTQLELPAHPHFPRVAFVIYALFLVAATLKVYSMPVRSFDGYYYAYLASGENLDAFKRTPGLPHEWQIIPEDVVAYSRGFFVVKPLFVLLTKIAIRAAGVLNAPFLVSTVAYFGLGWVLWFWLGELGVSVLWRLPAASLLMFSSVATNTGRKGGPDMLCTLLFVAGAWLLLSSRYKPVGILVLLAAIFTRTDSLVFAGLLLLLAAWRRQISLRAFSLWSLAMLFSDFLVARRGYSYSKFLSTALQSSYFYGLTHNLAHSELAVYAPFVLLALIALKLRFQTDLVVACLAAWVVRYLLLPRLEERYLLPQAMILGILAAGAALGKPQASGVSHLQT